MATFSETRIPQPSQNQVEALISFMETRLDLARGFKKSKVHRERAHKDWYRIGLKLNNMPGGAVKTTQRWIKYWSDKKSAVKRKAALIDSCKQNGDQGECPELTDLEKRILAILPPNAGNSMLYKHLKQEPTEHHQIGSTHNSILATYLLEDEMGEDEEDQTETPNDEEDTFLSTYRFNDSNQSKHREENNHNQQTPTVSSTRWGSLKLPQKPDPPPDPLPANHSNFFLVADKLCRIEQQRLELDRRMVEVMERNSERDHMLAEAVKAMGEGLKALAEAISKN